MLSLSFFLTSFRFSQTWRFVSLSHSNPLASTLLLRSSYLRLSNITIKLTEIREFWINQLKSRVYCIFKRQIPFRSLALLFSAHATLVLLPYISERRNLRYQRRHLPRITSSWLWRMIGYTPCMHTYNEVHSTSIDTLRFSRIMNSQFTRYVKEERNRSSIDTRCVRKIFIRNI